MIVPTYNRRHLLPRVIDPLLADPATTEVVCVVDGSRDGSFDWVSQRSSRDARLKVLFVDRVGRTAARRAALEASTGQVVLMIDDDVIPDEGLVSGHAFHHAKEHGLVVIGYMPTPRPPRREPGNFSTFLYAEQYEAHCQEWESAPNNILLHLWGGNVSIRRTDIARVGGLELPGLDYHGDYEFGLRCHKAGLQGRFDRKLRASHLHHRSLEGLFRDARAQGRSWARIGSIHADLIRPAGAAPRRRGPLERLVAVLAQPAFEPLMRCSLLALVRVAGRMRALSVEQRAGLLLKRIQQERGRREGLSELS